MCHLGGMTPPGYSMTVSSMLKTKIFSGRTVLLFVLVPRADEAPVCTGALRHVTQASRSRLQVQSERFHANTRLRVCQPRRYRIDVALLLASGSRRVS